MLVSGSVFREVQGHIFKSLASKLIGWKCHFVPTKCVEHLHTFMGGPPFPFQQFVRNSERVSYIYITIIVIIIIIIIIILPSLLYHVLLSFSFRITYYSVFKHLKVDSEIKIT